MGHYKTIYKEVEVDIDIDADDVLDFINGCDKDDLAELDEALQKRARKLKERRGESGVLMRVHCLPTEEFQAGQLQELINKVGVEDAVRALSRL